MVIFHGKQMHSLIRKHGFDSDVFVGSALVDMYAKCGEMIFAKILFDEMPERNLVSWNSMIVGFLQNKLYDETVEFFVHVVRDDLINPDQVSFSSVLSACANVRGVDMGRQVHGVVIKSGLEYLPYVKNSLMDMYSKCGVFDDAENLFRTIEDRDVVTWNVMMMGCVQNNSFEEACNYFWMMRREGISPDEASFSTVLHAAASIAALDQGSLIHDQIIKTGFETNTCVSSSLVTMYAKCGSLIDGRRVFTESEDRNVVLWTATISACQQHGCADQVIELFEDMLREGIRPDYITFVSVLSACGHTGRVDEGFSYFNSMIQTHNITPGSEHYACMVDLLGRAGKLLEAKKFIETMPIEPDISVWGALLGACRKYGDLELGGEVAKRLFQIEPTNPGNYVLLGNMYARAGMLDEADEVRRLMGVNKVRKEPGCSWLDVKNTTYVFTAHDKSHSRTNEIYKMLGKLEEMVKQKGYIAETQYAINNVDEYKERSLWYHSEKLALAYGLLVLPEGAPIRIKKNLRTCGDCHTVMKFASEIFRREIIVRDINRFHRFSNGLCSCNDYW
ncbi:pentatricopeptide repeat-containing protein At2g22070-like [Olea europaea var. sylvestris]|uniref:pentatricopeptide repeat-containing protein At2g22070-like n=1 Tax=Olea europaea var. sylvestris TaxID=158386 RepID=UPI000C1D441A|nr:pentatricopeptide repeat-containing protein At2g22070-like [Olea europaea var. sylvestris]